MLDFNDCIKVGIADYKIISTPGKMVTVGLGSCVGVCIYDIRKKIGGLAHILLPTKQAHVLKKDADLRSADVAVPKMIEEMVSMGCDIKHFRAVLVGGGNMFIYQGKDVKETIGYKNQQSVKKVLSEYRIPIVCDDMGGTVGKTVFFDTENGDVYVRAGVDLVRIYKGF